jgi:hypothetical protein
MKKNLLYVVNLKIWGTWGTGQALTNLGRFGARQTYVTATPRTHTRGDPPSPNHQQLEEFVNKSRKGIDWGATMLEYVTTDVSLRDVAAKLGCNVHAVERRSALDGWSAARDKFRAQVGHRAQALQVETRAHKLRDWNDNDLKIAKAIRGQTTRASGPGRYHRQPRHDRRSDGRRSGRAQAD